MAQIGSMLDEIHEVLKKYGVKGSLDNAEDDDGQIVIYTGLRDGGLGSVEVIETIEPEYETVKSKYTIED